jgi:hypothetical protein
VTSIQRKIERQLSSGCFLPTCWNQRRKTAVQRWRSAVGNAVYLRIDRFSITVHLCLAMRKDMMATMLRIHGDWPSVRKEQRQGDACSLIAKRL